MRNIILLLFLTFTYCNTIFSQAPNLMSYQAVIWDASGNLVSEKTVSIKISILQGSVTGTSVYSETHRLQTNINGLVSLMIGGGTNATGKISDINWGSGSYFLKTETDPTGGGNFSITGTTQLVSVPYSLASNISNISELARNISTKNTGLPGQTLTIDKDGKMIWLSNLPTISTNAITDIKPNSSVSGGNILSDGGSPVTARGVVWSTNPNPTISLATKTNDGLGMGNFASNLTGLSSNTTYYVRAYASNSVGTSYGNEVSFTTLVNLPILSTTPINALTSTTAMSGGSIASDGGSPVTTRGVVWSTNPNPTISSSTKTNDGAGIGSYSSSVSGLTANTIYYIRSYASNIAGTGYGNELSFNATAALTMNIPCPGIPTVKDIDGNIYNTVQIGNQCWLKENLRVTKYNDGSTIYYGLDGDWVNRTLGVKLDYNFDSTNLKTYGYLYNFYAITDNKKICPKGWHIPSDTIWYDLLNFVGAEYTFKLKSTEGWIYNGSNFNGTNETGFSALPGGRFISGFGTFRDRGNLSFFWSSSVPIPKITSEWIIDSQIYRELREFTPDDERVKTNAYSVRCVKD